MHRAAELLGCLVQADPQVDAGALLGSPRRGRCGDRLPDRGIPRPGAVEGGCCSGCALGLTLAIQLAESDRGFLANICVCRRGLIRGSAVRLTTLVAVLGSR